MNRSFRAAGGLCLLSAAAAPAWATPIVDSAVLHLRVFNDFPTSTLVTTNNYPALISFSDGPVGPGAFANRHNFRLSDNGGISDAVFLNGDAFSIEAHVTLTGTGPVEGGLQVSPWFSQQVDGQFNIRSTDGEIAVFGGRLPFFNFTATFGLHYVHGTTIHQRMIYDPHSLSMADPGTIEYIYTDASGSYTSGPLAFSEGNPAEDPPFGLWGILNEARVGGCVQIMNFDQNQHTAGARFENIVFIPAPASAALLALGGLVARRRRG
jgi:hypothetical protein